MRKIQVPDLKFLRYLDIIYEDNLKGIHIFLDWVDFAIKERGHFWEKVKQKACQRKMED